MYISDFTNGTQTLQGKVGSLAINANDVLELNHFGRLYTAAVSDYAASGNVGNAIVAATTVGVSCVVDARKAVIKNPVDGSVFIGSLVSIAPTLFKFSTAGALLGNVTLDVGGENIILQLLTNGNVLAVWGTAAGTLSFSVWDTNLNNVVPLTVVASGTTLITAYFDALALSGGGFALAYGLSTGATLAIYTNTGGVTAAPATVSGTPTAGIATKLCQQSGGNLAIAISSTAASHAAGHAIYSVAGVMILAYTNLSAGSNSAQMYPEISAIANYYCVAGYDGTNSVAYVLNNAGTLQGAPFSFASSVTTSSVYQLLNDGTNFEFITRSGGVTALVFIPTTGTGYVTTLLGSIASGPIAAFYEHESIILEDNGVVNVLSLSASGSASIVLTFSLAAAFGTPAWITALPVGDFAFLVFNLTATAGAATYAIYKYMDTAIVGISQSTIAAGNSGAIVNYSMGPGGFQCNAVTGTIGKSFDHSATNIIGNKGTILGNSVSLKGI